MTATLKRNVDSLLDARGLSLGDLSLRLKVPTDELNRIIGGQINRKETLLKGIATELLVPDFFLFLEDLPPIPTSIPDFRLSNPKHAKYSRETLKTIELARSIQHSATSLATYDNLRKLRQSNFTELGIVKTAASIRKTIGLTTRAQFDARDARIFYADVRKSIERHQIFVLQDSFPSEDGAGFCLSQHVGYDMIVINTLKQSYERRLFTLAHELCHVILGQSGVSDPNVTSSVMERRCNKFAGHFLAPDDLVDAAAKLTIKSNTLDISELRAFSKLTKLSLYASLLRLIEVGRYRDSAHGAWASYVSSQGDPDYGAPSGGGGRTDEWKYKLARYGFAFASIFGHAKQSGALDDLEIYRIAGIKPKWQDAYFENASSARAEDVQDA